MDKQAELNNSKDIIFYLSQQFPNCFSIEGVAKPLKIGIFQELAIRLSDNDSLSKTKLRTALRAYTISWRYLYSIKEGQMRVDLDGNPGEVITQQQAEHALAQLKESQALAKQKRIAKSTLKTEENKDNSIAVSVAPAPVAKKTTAKTSSVKPKAQSFSKKPVNKKETKPAFSKIELSSLSVGDSVNVILGSKPISALVLAIEKEHIRVKIASGMELTVTSEHLVRA